MRKKTVLNSCFIIAPIAINTKPLRDLLTYRGIRVKDSLSIPLSADAIVSAIESAIRGADFVCAIISLQTSPNVFFEIGLAYCARKPLFLIVDKDVDLPTILNGVFYVRASPLDVDAIQFNLDNFLEHLPGRVPSKYEVPVDFELPKIHRDDEIKFLREIDVSENGRALKTFVVNLLEKVNMVMAQDSYYPDSGVDIAIWLDSIEATLGNPVLVEVKAGQLSEQFLREAESQLRHYLTKTNARVGLLIYFDQSGRRFPASSPEWPLVVRLDVRDFIDLLSENALATVLIAERNKAVHRKE